MDGFDSSLIVILSRESLEISISLETSPTMERVDEDGVDDSLQLTSSSVIKIKTILFMEV
jgi:hypothetical protein